MWVRLGRFQVKAGAAEALRTIYNEQAVPRVRSQPGNLGCLLLEPVLAEEQHAVLTFWRDRAAADAYEASGTAREVVDLVRTLFAGPPTLRSYESTSAGAFTGSD
jgi:heme-degrading monooxygenase HmoA